MRFTYSRTESLLTSYGVCNHAKTLSYAGCDDVCAIIEPVLLMTGYESSTSESYDWQMGWVELVRTGRLYDGTRFEDAPACSAKLCG